MKPRLLLALLGLLALAAPCTGQAQAISRACPKAAEVTHDQLFGLWRAEFEGLARGATLLLEQHPQLKDSVRGEINRNGERAWLAGDIEDGELMLEESVNGVNISAAWVGDVVEGSCGREVRGLWKADGTAREYPFVLRKQ